MSAHTYTLTTTAKADNLFKKALEIEAVPEETDGTLTNMIRSELTKLNAANAKKNNKANLNTKRAANKKTKKDSEAAMIVSLIKLQKKQNAETKKMNAEAQKYHAHTKQLINELAKMKEDAEAATATLGARLGLHAVTTPANNKETTEMTPGKETPKDNDNKPKDNEEEDSDDDDKVHFTLGIPTPPSPYDPHSPPITDTTFYHHTYHNCTTRLQ